MTNFPPATETIFFCMADRLTGAFELAGDLALGALLVGTFRLTAGAGHVQKSRVSRTTMAASTHAPTAKAGTIQAGSWLSALAGHRSCPG